MSMELPKDALLVGLDRLTGRIVLRTQDFELCFTVDQAEVVGRELLSIVALADARGVARGEVKMVRHQEKN